MTSLFVSYSRRDADCARRLTESFKGQDLDFWIDWEGIPPTVDWWSEVERGIERAGVFVFLVSPASIHSKVCRREIDHALKNGKRLIPVVVREVNAEEAPSVLSHLNWIFLRENDDFEAGFQKLITAIKTDYDWVRSHRELQVNALEWERNKHDKSYLLRGTELQLAEFQFTTNAAKDPRPTALQREYVSKSRQAASRQRTIILSIGIAVGIAITVLGIFGWVKAVEANSNAQTALNNAATAVANAQIARAGELSAFAFFQGDERLDLSLLLSVEAWNAQDTQLTRIVLLDYTQMNPQLTQYIHGHSRWVSSVAFSPDGKLLASGSYDNSILLWDVASHQPINQPLVGHSNSVDSLAFSQDGRTLASGSCGKLDQNNDSCVEGMIILWNVETGKRIGQPLTAHSREITTVMFSPDGRTLASGSRDNSIVLLDVASQRPLSHPLIGENSSVHSLVFSPDGKLIAWGSDRSTIVLWDIANQQLIDLPTEDNGSIMMVAFSPDGNTLASTASYDIGITLWDVEKREAIGKLDPGYNFSVTSLAFSANGQTLASGGGNNESLEGFGSDVILWDIGTLARIGQPLSGQRGQVTSILFKPDGAILAAGSVNATVLLWDLGEQHPIGQPLTEHNEPIQSIAFSPDGKTLASVGEQNIMWWDMANRQSIGQSPAGNPSSVRLSAFSPDGKLLASVRRDDTNIFLWDVERRELIGQLPTGYRYGVSSLAFSRDGRTLASGGMDSPIILWDVDELTQMGQLPTESGYGVSSLAFSPDCTILASGESFEVGGTSDYIVRFWDVENLQSIGNPLTGHSGSITGLAFSPDGTTLASGSWDSTIILWDVRSQEKIGSPLMGQLGYLSSVAFSPDGKILAAARTVENQANYDYSILLWDVASRQRIGQPLMGHRNAISSVVFSPDGKTLASGSRDGSIILWDLDPASWIELACQRAGRNLTRAEWGLYFPNEEYRHTCPQWPLEPEAEITTSPTP